MGRNIIDLQLEDHARLDGLLHAYGNQAAVERRSTFREIVDLVTTHGFAEEEILFPATRKALGDLGERITSDIESQHQRINELLVEMERFEPGQEEFEARVRELFPLLRTDVRNEEDRLLASLRDVMDTAALERVGATWAVAKAAAPNRAHPRVPRRPPWNMLAGVPLLFVDRVRHWFARFRNTAQ